MKTITEQKIKKYIEITEKALEGIKIMDDKAKDVLDMAIRYFKDAQYYKQKGDFVTAFACINYAHGWLDAGARLKLFKVKHKELFTID